MTRSRKSCRDRSGVIVMYNIHVIHVCFVRALSLSKALCTTQLQQERMRLAKHRLEPEIAPKILGDIAVCWIVILDNRKFDDAQCDVLHAQAS